MSIAKLAEALNKAQSVMGGAKKDKINPFFKSSYSDLSSVFEAIKQPFADNELSITQVMDVLENGNTVLITKLLHNSGEHLESKMLLPQITDCQKLGSAITYFRRYSLMGICGLSSEDDDGNSATKEVKKQSQLLGEKKANKLKEGLIQFPEYRAEVEAYLDRGGIDYKNLTIENARKIQNKLNKLIADNMEDEDGEQEVNHG